MTPMDVIAVVVVGGALLIGIIYMVRKAKRHGFNNWWGGK